ncbi:MAG: DUF47 family protein [Chryseobacterium sp.]|nr:MAG: DUF47 family protein [Chryseobacterium sp.]
MGFANFIRAFQPKDKIFYVLFEKVTENLVAMSTDFHKGMLNFDNNDDSMMKLMSEYEHKNDDLTHEIFVELGKNFITPFDREDITELATGLDDIADYIFASAKYIFMYKSPETKAYSEFSLLIQKACLEIQTAMKHLNGFTNMPAVKESCIKINSIENIADDVLTNAMVQLFESDDAINVIKVKSVLDYLEIVTDKAEDVANTIENIMIKYS